MSYLPFITCSLHIHDMQWVLCCNKVDRSKMIIFSAHRIWNTWLAQDALVICLIISKALIRVIFISMVLMARSWLCSIQHFPCLVKFCACLELVWGFGYLPFLTNFVQNVNHAFGTRWLGDPNSACLNFFIKFRAMNMNIVCIVQVIFLC